MYLTADPSKSFPESAAMLTFPTPGPHSAVTSIPCGLIGATGFDIVAEYAAVTSEGVRAKL